MNDASDAAYTVVVNGEAQYSIWPVGRAVPGGWSGAGFSGPRAECLQYIDTVWTDMRPLSLRRRIETIAAPCAESPA
jgi:MbtH protein